MWGVLSFSGFQGRHASPLGAAHLDTSSASRASRGPGVGERGASSRAGTMYPSGVATFLNRGGWGSQMTAWAEGAAVAGGQGLWPPMDEVAAFGAFSAAALRAPARACATKSPERWWGGRGGQCHRS